MLCTIIRRKAMPCEINWNGQSSKTHQGTENTNRSSTEIVQQRINCFQAATFEMSLDGKKIRPEHDIRKFQHNPKTDEMIIIRVKKKLGWGKYNILLLILSLLGTLYLSLSISLSLCSSWSSPDTWHHLQPTVYDGMGYTLDTGVSFSNRSEGSSENWYKCDVICVWKMIYVFGKM